MRLVEALEIDGRPAALSSTQVHLALSSVSFGIFDVRGDWRNTEGQPARLRMGYGGGLLMPQIQGHVAEAHLLSQGLSRIVVRDVAAALEAPARIFLRHPTPAEVLNAITERTGLRFRTPDENAPEAAQALMRKRIPLFCAPGDCRAALNSLGAAFGVHDAVWAALPQARSAAQDTEAQDAPQPVLYWGPYAASPWSKFALPVPEGLIVKRDPGARSLLLRPMPALRPGVRAVVDGQAFVVWSIEHRGGELPREMRVSWRPLRNKEGKFDPGIGDPFRVLMFKAAPELNGMLTTRLGRVVGIADSIPTEAMTNRFRPRYAVDVELLDAAGQPDQGWPRLEGLALPAMAAGDGAGLYAFPEIGAQVRIGFDYASPSYPYIAQVLSEGRAVPPLAPGEVVLRSAMGAELRMNTRGDLRLQCDAKLELDSLETSVVSEELNETLGRVQRKVAIDVMDEIQGSLHQTAMGARVLKVGTDERKVVLGGSETVIGGDQSKLIGGGAQVVANQGLTLIANLGKVLIESKTNNVELKAAGGIASLMLDLTKAELRAPTLAAGNGVVELLAILEKLLQALQMEKHMTLTGLSSPPQEISLMGYKLQQSLLTLIRNKK